MNNEKGFLDKENYHSRCWLWIQLFRVIELRNQSARSDEATPNPINFALRFLSFAAILSRTNDIKYRINLVAADGTKSLFMVNIEGALKRIKSERKRLKFYDAIKEKNSFIGKFINQQTNP